jgi:hypothetical protein
MGKVLRPHKASGYITSVKYHPTIDAQNQPDWILYLTPGPKARDEYDAANGKRKSPRMINNGTVQPANRDPHRRRSMSRHDDLKLEAAASQPIFDPQLIAEFTRRGITEKKASELLANLKPGQDVVAQLELGEHIVKSARIPINNPPGFYIRLIESNTSVPDSFETKAKRTAREENERKERERRAAEDARWLLESEYDDYCSRETDRYILENSARFDALKDAKREETRARFTSFSPDMVESMAGREARSAIEKEIGLPTLEEFADQKHQDTVFSLKPVAVLASAETLPLAPPHQDIVMTDDAVVPPEAGETPADWEAEMQPGPKVTMQPATPDAGIDEPPPESAGPGPGTNPADPAAF